MHTLLLLGLLSQAPGEPTARVALPSRPAFAPPEDPSPRALAFSWVVDSSVAAGLGLAWLLSETAFKKDLAPPQCRWCGHNALDDEIRRAFAPAGSLTFDGIKGPDVASGVFAYVVAPVAVLGIDALLAGSLKGWGQDSIIILEAVMAALAVSQGVKFAVGRQRPFVSDLTPAQQAMTRDPSDNNLSFYSGHATFTAAFAVAGGMVALQRGYKHPWLVWLVGSAISVTTSVLRLAADKHYFTDVLLGTLTGAAMGVALPMLFHRVKVEATVAPGGMALRGHF